MGRHVTLSWLIDFQFSINEIKMVDFIFSPLYNVERRRGVAQLVEHYLREVGAACSNHVTPID